MRDIDHDAVRAGPFHLEIGVAAGCHCRIDMVLCGQPLAVRAFELLASLVEIVDLEAEMMDAGEVRAVRAHVGRFLVLGVEDRDVDVTVGQKHRAVRAAPQFLEAESRFVELGDLRRFPGGQCDVLDAGHDLLPFLDGLPSELIAGMTRSKQFSATRESPPQISPLPARLAPKQTESGKHSSSWPGLSRGPSAHGLDPWASTPLMSRAL